jgi:ankyrin repeat protein
MRALYEGDSERARPLLARDDELSIFDAAAFGRLARLQELLDTDPLLARATSEDGFTLLHLAVFAKQEEAAGFLIDHGADVNARATASIAQVPPPGTAAFVGSVSLARLLLDRGGADVNGRGAGGFTALHTAANNGDEPLARLLLGRGADKTLADQSGTQPADIGLRDLLA